MIFITVGSQLPFDRLIKGVDEWEHIREVEVQAQVVSLSGYEPRNFSAVEFISAAEYEENIRKAELVVSHAGIGVIFTAKNYGVPLIVMPRKHELKEVRNNHQLATVKYFKDVSGIYVAGDTTELQALLERRHELKSEKNVEQRPERLLERLRLFIEKGV